MKVLKPPIKALTVTLLPVYGQIPPGTLGFKKKKTKLSLLLLLLIRSNHYYRGRMTRSLGHHVYIA